jgi:hypothetical protein
VVVVEVRIVDILYESFSPKYVTNLAKRKIDKYASQKENMATFDFVFMCMILYKEKCEINYASKTPQKKDIGLGESAFMFNRLCVHISDLGN